MSKGLGALKTIRYIHDCECGQDKSMDERFDIIEKELKAKEKYEDFVQEICRYIGLDNLFPYDNLEEIEKEIKTIADNSHWFAVKLNQKKLKALEIISQNFRLMGNCLHAKNKYAESGWVFVKEIENEEELQAWKEALTW